MAEHSGGPDLRERLALAIERGLLRSIDRNHGWCDVGLHGEAEGLHPAPRRDHGMQIDGGIDYADLIDEIITELKAAGIGPISD